MNATDPPPDELDPAPTTSTTPSEVGAPVRSPRTLTVGLIGLVVTAVLAPVQFVIVLTAAGMATDGFESAEPAWMDAARQSFWIPAAIGGISVLLVAYGIVVWFVRDWRTPRRQSPSQADQHGASTHGPDLPRGGHDAA